MFSVGVTRYWIPLSTNTPTPVERGEKGGQGERAEKGVGKGLELRSRNRPGKNIEKKNYEKPWSRCATITA